ncbi:bile acid:sodium symporter family protein [Halalkalibacter krulwichiae]|uniref:Sodium Bile acid symporter family protein n=1 Tax=Halalkalibacter krulwichiae TaxID=199441 RepID=A0A1X9MGI6_9BACI|nr:bile acid:sodium symporter family protein [Halalkalibacter krulwichiae]ARK29552.1 Sodium Bile acid symporter family protein [Halalkalibacter krulwichiae]
MLKTINSQLEKKMPYLTPISVIVGLLLADAISSWVIIVPWIFAFITLSSSVGVKLEKMKNALLHPGPILLSLIIIQVIMPCIAYVVGHMFFSGEYLTIVGIIIAFVIPTGVISLMWVSIYKGNTSVTLLIVLINTLLSPLLIPFSLQVLVGASVEVNTTSLMSSLFFMIVVPSLLGIALNYFPFTKQRDVKSTLAPFSKVGLMLVIGINASVAAPVVTFDTGLVKIAFVIFLLASSGYLLGVLAGKMLKINNDVVISLLFNCGMRNISVGAAIAILYFPPQVSVPVVMGTLFQQTLAAIYGRILVTYLKKKESTKQALKIVN